MTRMAKDVPGRQDVVVAGSATGSPAPRAVTETRGPRAPIASDPQPLLRMRGIYKSFGGVHALRDVDFEISAGEVHALTGENGSGKSTLAKIASGLIAPDAGSLEIDGQECSLSRPSDAMERGIVLISQELTLAPTLTVAENVLLGRAPTNRFGMIDWRETYRRSAAALDMVGIDVSLDARVSDLSVELQQEVEIARAFSSSARLLILDEATSSLSESATERLLELVRQRQQSGVAVLKITHRMPEIYAVCSGATVLRDGRLVGSVDLPETGEEAIVRMMVGRDLEDYFGKRVIPRGDTVLAASQVSTPDGSLRDVSLDIRRGEIVGVAGLEGSGKAELGRVLGGAAEYTGLVEVVGKPAVLDNPRTAKATGIGYVPDDRKGEAIFPTRDVAENLSIAWNGIVHHGIVDVAEERRQVARSMESYRIVGSSQQLITTLSGGNQQKVVLGRTFENRPEVLVLSEPTRGIDVGAKSEVYQLVQNAAEEGAGVLMISSELPELLGLADRILVMHGGEVCAEFDTEGLDEASVVHVAVTGKQLDTHSDGR